MADKKISQLTAASTPLAGTEVLPIVQSGSTVKVSSDDLTVKNVRSNATTGILQIAGPGAGTTRVMTTPNANFTAARTDAGNAFTGVQTIDSNVAVGTTTVSTTLGRNITINGAGAGTNTGIIFSNASTENALAYSNSTNFVLGSRTNIPVLFTVNDGEVGRFTTSGNLAFPAGKGIDFSANTHAAGMTSELLNWYEEGSFNIGLTTAGGNFTAITIADSNATYTRIGRQVTVRGFFYTSGSITGGSGQVKITGLPFSSAGISVGRVWVNPDTGNYNSPVAAPTTCTPSGTEILLWKDGTTNNPTFVSTDLTSGGNSNYIAFALTYFV
jgi:hypothetical protein